MKLDVTPDLKGAQQDIDTWLRNPRTLRINTVIKDQYGHVI